VGRGARSGAGAGAAVRPGVAVRPGAADLRLTREPWEGSRTLPRRTPPGKARLRPRDERRLRGVPEPVVRGLFAWDRGERPVDLLFEVPPARRVLALQARGRRCVCLLDDAAAREHGDPRHPTGLAFALHDLCHLEKFVAPEHHAGQIGFFRLVERALETPALAALDRELDDAWRADRDYVLADMNGSAVFLLAALKMRLTLAVRRRGATRRRRWTCCCARWGCRTTCARRRRRCGGIGTGRGRRGGCWDGSRAKDFWQSATFLTRHSDVTK
jgi:hypothetical protein